MEKNKQKECTAFCAGDKQNKEKEVNFRNVTGRTFIV